MSRKSWAIQAVSAKQVVSHNKLDSHKPAWRIEILGSTHPALMPCTRPFQAKQNGKHHDCGQAIPQQPIHRHTPSPPHQPRRPRPGQGIHAMPLPAHRAWQGNRPQLDQRVQPGPRRSGQSRRLQLGKALFHRLQDNAGGSFHARLARYPLPSVASTLPKMGNFHALFFLESAEYGRERWPCCIVNRHHQQAPSQEEKHQKQTLHFANDTAAQF